MIEPGFDTLRAQLLDVAHAMRGDAVDELLSGLLSDVDRGLHEPLELFPVAHHSPASAIAMVRRLTDGPTPKVIFMEGCEDLQPLLASLPGCKWPISLQAFAGQSDAFPPDWTPLSSVCPLTPFSAEFQAIAYAHHHPETTLVLIDRSVDHVFQWREITPDTKATDDDEPDEETIAVGAFGIGLEMGAVRPTLERFVTLLLRNSKARHYMEWWTRYVEAPLLQSDVTTYRQMMLLVGSLIRRLGTRERDRENDRRRERYMWTRIKDWLEQHQVSPADAMYICGAAHTASDVEEFGSASPHRWEIPSASGTRWLYGLTPSSFSAIEHQFHHPPGTLAQAEAEWDKALKRYRLTAFSFEPAKKKKPVIPLPAEGTLGRWLIEPPPPVEFDEAQLLQWSVNIVGLARKNGYLASTADSIAIYETSRLLANLRDRAYPTPWDFMDAAITCLEKDRVPKKRNILRLCEILLASDRIGQVAYTSLPPLARDVIDRLNQAGVNTEARTIQRVLFDFRANPSHRSASQLLWKLAWLWEGRGIVRPIMGEKVLGRTPIQESWDVAIGKHQGELIQFGYEGLTIEHVMEKRLKKTAFSEDATTLIALEATYQAVLLLGQPRLNEELGDRANHLLLCETSGVDAPEIFKRVRELVHHFRAAPEGIPGWLGRLVTGGYRHFSSILPNAFIDDGTSANAIAGMLSFLFTLEALALSLGCQRSQLEFAIRQSGQASLILEKRALWWTAEVMIGIRSLASIRQLLEEMVGDPLQVDGLPDLITGFLLALSFSPAMAPLVVEIVSRAFATLPQAIAFRWLPALITALRHTDPLAVAALFREAESSLPQNLGETETWSAYSPNVDSNRTSVTPGSAIAAWLRHQPDTTNAVARLLDVPTVWSADTEQAAVKTGVGQLASFIHEYPETTIAVQQLLHGKERL